MSPTPSPPTEPTPPLPPARTPNPSAGHKHSIRYDAGYLSVSPLHAIFYEQYGSPTGKTALFLHGGPGAQTSPNDTLFFDPALYRVVLFDQRGAGKSLPNGELRENTSQDLAADIEKLREHLGVGRWEVVLGASWGSTLALLYAQTFPERVGRLVVQGVFGMSRSETEFTKGADGAAVFFPQEYEEFLSILTPEETRNPLGAYYKRLTSSSSDTQVSAAKAWTKWGMSIFRLIPDPAFRDKILAMLPNPVHFARMEAHYEINGGFMEDGQLLKKENVEKIRHIPCSIIQGRYDLSCPPKTAWELHKALPESRLYMVEAAGHLPNEPGLLKKVIEICDEYALQLCASDGL